MTTFKEKYDNEVRWPGKIIIMELYHLTQLHHNPKHTCAMTAKYFGIGKSTVSENLKIAKAIHDGNPIDKLKTREEASCAINNRPYRGK